MTDSEDSRRYAGFAGVECAHVRRRFHPTFDWRVFDQPSPRHRVKRPIEAARVALVGTAGASVVGQPAFSLGDDGDPSFREIPADAERIRLSHVGYDVPRARRDPDVVFPLALLRALAADGMTGEVAPRNYSFMGYVPDAEPLLSDSAPEVARRLCADLPTVSMTQVPEITRLVQPSLACFVAHRFGLTLGAVGDKATQREVVLRCLQEAAAGHAAGTIVDLGFSWPDDLRERRLRREAR